MLLRFIGTYTGGRSSITIGDYVFEGDKPTKIDARTDMGKRLAKNPDFERCDKDGDGHDDKTGEFVKGNTAAKKPAQKAAPAKKAAKKG